MDDPITVQWASVVGVYEGKPYVLSHDFVHEVKARRPATLDDIYAAASLASKQDRFTLIRPSTDTYTVAFLVFQLPDGHISVSPDIFENFIPVSSPTDAQLLGAFGALQGQIVAQWTANMAAQVAVQATLSVLNAGAKEANKAAGKSEGGLFVA